MTFPSRYITAVEMRLRWLKWAKSDAGRSALIQLDALKLIPNYLAILEQGETFFMEEQFCSLVDHARADVPSDLAFEARWLVVPHGFMWLAVPFVVPDLDSGEGKRESVTIRAIGWRTLEAGLQVCSFYEMGLVDPDLNGFAPWSSFMLHDGDQLVARVKAFEGQHTRDGQYQRLIGNDETALHEMRWAYAAFHLMAQKLAVSVRHDTDRATRRRAEREGQTAPPFVHAITLRRLQQARASAGHAAEAPDWHWQWIVGGHWRNQWFPAAGTHKPVFIDSYVKGPADKPMKAETTRLYVARR